MFNYVYGFLHFRSNITYPDSESTDLEIVNVCFRVSICGFKHSIGCYYDLSDGTWLPTQPQRVHEILKLSIYVRGWRSSKMVLHYFLRLFRVQVMTSLTLKPWGLKVRNERIYMVSIIIKLIPIIISIFLFKNITKNFVELRKINLFLSYFYQSSIIHSL